jgi:hypothetical protein
VRESRTQSGLSLHTLLIAGAASAAAAFIIPFLWEPGTVFAAATTPIIVALVTEGLKRPTETVKTVRSARRSATQAHPVDVDFDPLAPPPPEDLAALPATTTERTVRSSRGFRLTPRQWKLGLATGALAFVLAVAFVTASELLAGEKLGGSGNPTTFFSRDSREQSGGGADDDHEQEASPEATREPGATPTATPGATTPEATATPAPAQTAVPTPTPTPTATPAPLGAEPTASPAPAP